MTDEEFILKAAEIFNNLKIPVQICNAPFTDTLFLGSFSYMGRNQLVEVSKEILKLEGYELVTKAIES